MYKVEVFGRELNDSNVNRNVKKVYVGSTNVPFKKDITITEVVSHTRYIDIEIVYLNTWENLGTDPILKKEIVKKFL